MKEFVGLKAKRCSYLNNNDEDKNAKDTKKCVIKIKLKFQDYKNCSEAAQIESKRNHLEKNKIDVVRTIYINCIFFLLYFIFERRSKRIHKKNNLILKTQQRFRIEKHNVFTEEINKIALNSNDDKRMQ